MKREWKPGDVLANEAGETVYVIKVTGNTIAATKTGQAWVEGSCVITPDGNGWRPDAFANLRPLAVIDPEDREQVERFIRALDRATDGVESESIHPDRLRNFTKGFREFASPTPPRPDEPLELGAVVEDAEGRKWVRTLAHFAWTFDGIDESNDHYRDECHYADIKAVRVLSQGVPS